MIDDIEELPATERRNVDELLVTRPISDQSTAQYEQRIRMGSVRPNTSISANDNEPWNGQSSSGLFVCFFVCLFVLNSFFQSPYHVIINIIINIWCNKS